MRPGTGLRAGAQCSELTWQLRGTADQRQVPGAKVALQHNIGLGGAAVVTVYRPAAAGGKATANTDNIATWDGAKALVDQAVTDCGRLDVVVNHAGILHDAFVASTDEAQWDAVIDVHLKGHFAVMHHAAAYWKAESKAGYPVAGSVINTASISGTTMPNPGQANYGAARAGIAAMSLVAALELERYHRRIGGDTS